MLPTNIAVVPLSLKAFVPLSQKAFVPLSLKAVIPFLLKAHHPPILSDALSMVSFSTRFKMSFGAANSSDSSDSSDSSRPSSPEALNPIALTDLYARLFHNSRSSAGSPTIYIPANPTRAQIAAILALELRNDKTIVHLPNPSTQSPNGKSNGTTTESAKQPVKTPSNNTSAAASPSKVPTTPAEPVELQSAIDHPLKAFDEMPTDARERQAAGPTSGSSRLLYDEELLSSPVTRTASETSALDPQEMSVMEGSHGGI